MKLKIFRISLLFFLFSLFALSVFFFVKMILLIPSIESVSDIILFIISFLVLLAFIGLEISNTFVSIKRGSNFIKPLAYDRDGSLNKRGLVIFSILAVISLGTALYSLFVVLDYPLYFTFLVKPIQYLALCFFSVIATDMLFILLYPILGLKD